MSAVFSLKLLLGVVTVLEVFSLDEEHILIDSGVGLFGVVPFGLEIELGGHDFGH